MNQTDLIKYLSSTILLIKKTIRFFRIQDYYHAQWNWDTLIQRTQHILPHIPKDLANLFSDPLFASIEDICRAQENEDAVLIADYLELEFLPVWENTVQALAAQAPEKNTSLLERNLEALSDKTLAGLIADRAADPKDYGPFHVETTNLGLPTLRYLDNCQTYYYHSNADPLTEGAELAAYYARPDIMDYLFIGFGFGYPVRGMLEQDYHYKVIALESNLDVLALAFTSCDLTDILESPRFQLCLCHETEYISLIDKHSTHTVLIHKPSLASIRDAAIRNLLNDFFIRTSSIYAQEKLLASNFYYNLKLQDPTADHVLDSFTDKTVLFIAGGPSLEYFIDFVKEQQECKDSVILCASTVFRALVKKNIQPDLVILSDAQKTMAKHLHDVPVRNTALLYLSTASSNAVEYFSGRRFLCFQKGYSLAETAARERHSILFETGGSVSTLAIDLLLRTKCRKIYTLGLDLAYTDNRHHSYEVSESEIKESAALVRGVSGDMLNTTNLFNLYRRWIEKRTQREKESGIPIINLSHGAYIAGMDNRYSL